MVPAVSDCIRIVRFSPSMSVRVSPRGLAGDRQEAQERAEGRDSHWRKVIDSTPPSHTPRDSNTTPKEGTVMGPTYMIQARGYRTELESAERLQRSLCLGDERAYECEMS